MSRPETLPRPIRGAPVTAILGLLPLVIFALVLGGIAVRAPNILSGASLALILTQSLPAVLVCIGLAAVVMAGGDDVVSGGIDLSIPSTAVLGAGIAAELLVSGHPAWLAVLAALAAALAVGLVNALLVTRIGMTPLLATLAVSGAAIGLTKVVTASRRIDLDHPLVVTLRDGHVGGVPLGVAIVAGVALLAWHLLHRTRWGMALQAAGGSRDAAETMGVNTRRIQAQSFVFASFFGFAAGFFVLARGSGSTPGVEETLMMEMVLATFLGATFSPRRVVTLWGAVAGAVLVTAISVGFKTIGVDVFWTGLIKGVLICAVVALSAVAQGGRR